MGFPILQLEIWQVDTHGQSEDSRHLESIWFPVNSIDDVPERLVAYRRAICPTVLDYLRFLRP
jgi:hypothetical protein